jgi:Xaa-Pro dipeptidase
MRNDTVLLLAMLVIFSFTSRGQMNPTAKQLLPNYPDFLDTTLSQVVTGAELGEEIQEKLQRVHAFLIAQNLGGILLTRGCNIDWLTGGLADSHIVLTSELGAVSLLIMEDGRRFVIGAHHEAARILNEDLTGLGFQARDYFWYEIEVHPDHKLKFIRQLAGGKQVGSDVEYAGMRLVDRQFAPLRYELTDSEIEKYRWLGRNTTEAVTDVCRQLQPGMSERQIAAMTSCQLMKRGILPTVLLIGVDNRIFDYFHHVPTDAQLKQYAIVNVCARKWGLIVSVARFVHFGPLPAELARREQAAQQISARYEAHTIPGTSSGEIIKMAEQWFADNGYAGHWRDHHQGGAIGYSEREWIAAPDGREVIHPRQAFAWNPIVQGALSFDTIIAQKGYIENITTTADWPVKVITIGEDKYLMPDILIR